MSQEFLQALEAPDSPIAADLEVDSDRLLIVFGGGQGFVAITPFEFLNITRDIPTKKIFLRDFAVAWYQKGLPGIAPDIDGVAAYLRDIIKKHSIRRVVTVGNSMGGYAALLFGTLIEADAVIAIAPQSFISPWKTILALDYRWRRFLPAALRAVTNRAYLDIRNVIRDRTRKGLYRVYYSATAFHDKMHALNLRGTGVELVRYEEGGHKLVKHLRDSGELKRAFEEALGK